MASNDERPSKIELDAAEAALLKAREYIPDEMGGNERAEWYIKLAQTRALLSIAYSLDQMSSTANAIGDCIGPDPESPIRSRLLVTNSLRNPDEEWRNS